MDYLPLDSNPGKINLGSGGIGGPSHVAGELFKIMTGTDMLLVSYRGAGPSLVDLLAGQVQATLVHDATGPQMATL
jgi:tripartite-type tricarboxylate transporter receptor subunit TctC